MERAVALGGADPIVMLHPVASRHCGQPLCPAFGEKATVGKRNDFNDGGLVSALAFACRFGFSAGIG
jgi:hypothetical protein